MGLRIITVDAFTDTPFAGNPAAVCVLPEARDERWMQAVAREMNLSETAFLRKDEGGYRCGGSRPRWRWTSAGTRRSRARTPCGRTGSWRRRAAFASPRRAESSPLRGTVTRSSSISRRPRLRRATRRRASSRPSASGERQVHRSRFDYLVELGSELEVRDLKPDHGGLRSLGVRGVMVTARGEGEHDVVSRFFAPGAGIDEDPVTGSAHCCIGPYWAERLKKTALRCFQASERGGSIRVKVLGETG